METTLPVTCGRHNYQNLFEDQCPHCLEEHLSPEDEVMEDVSYESLIDGYYQQMKLCVGIMDELTSVDPRNYQAVQKLQVKALACRDQMTIAVDDILDYDDMFDEDWDDDDWDDDWEWEEEDEDWDI